MSVLLRRGPLEIIQVEALVDVDGQGAPDYDTPVTVSARTVRTVEVLKGASGETIRSIATLWIDAGEDALPDKDDRVVLSGGVAGIVFERFTVKDLKGVVDHVRIRIREE